MQHHEYRQGDKGYCHYGKMEYLQDSVSHNECVLVQKVKIGNFIIFADGMAKKIEKTNAARLLDKAGISYKLIPYEFDENDLAAQHVAESLGQDIARVFKTLVLHGDRTGHIVCVVPGDGEVDLKALAKVSGNKKVEMIAMKDLLSVTGYIRGGCSPIGMKKRFPTYFHSSALSFETIYVSAGVRGLQIEISPTDLVGFTGGVVADVACFQ